MTKKRSSTYSSGNAIPTSGQVLDSYWSTPVTRKEIQPIFDEYAAIMTDVQTLMKKFDVCMALVMEKLELTPEDVKAFFERKIAEMPATPPEPPSVTEN